jgi:hypothetical protein
MSKQKYYLVEWPESQEYMERNDCVPTDDMAYFVPCEVYDKIPTYPKSLEDPKEAVVKDNYNYD